MKLYVEDTADGKVRYKLPYTDTLTGKTKRISVTFDKDSPRNRREAERILSDKLEGMLGGMLSDDPTVEAAAKMFLDRKKMDLKASSLNAYTMQISHIISAVPKNARINHITPAAWSTILLNLYPDNVTGYNNAVKMLKCFLVWAYRNELLEYNVADKLSKLPDRSERVKVSEKYLEKDEVDKLLASMSAQPKYQLLTEFLVLSGLRIGETLVLTFEDIDGDVIHVTKTYMKNVHDVGSPKTFDSLRDVYIQPELASCLAKIKKWNRMQRAAYRLKGGNLLFLDSRTNDMIKYAAYQHYLVSKSEAVLGRRVTPHALRHTSASLMLSAGVPIETISRRLGHSSTAITERIYLHQLEELRKKDKEIIKEIRMLS